MSQPLSIEELAAAVAENARKGIRLTTLRNEDLAAELEAAFKKATAPAPLTWEDFHRRTDHIVEHYTPAVEHAMAQVLQGDTVRHAIRVAYTSQRRLSKAAPAPAPAPASPQAVNAAMLGITTPIPPALVGGAVGAALGIGGAVLTAEVTARATAAAILAAGLLSTVALGATLSELYSDAYVEGARGAGAAGAQLPVQLEAGAQGLWQSDPAAAALLRDGGLGRLLAEQNVRVKGITDTLLDRIGNAIAQGVASGASRRDTIAAVEAIIHDADRARMIVDTEVTRAMAAAAMERYRASGIERIKWLAHPDCCARCDVNAHAGPELNGVISIHDSWPMGPLPVHPNERCAVAPYFPA